MVYHACIAANPIACRLSVGAYSKRADGPVLYDDDKCIGCRYCMNACPFGVPHLTSTKVSYRAPSSTNAPCARSASTSAWSRLCATCPTDALMFGERADLLKEAHARIQAHPDRYIDHVYGETENGGTSYLILSHVPFSELGLPDLGKTPVKDSVKR